MDVKALFESRLSKHSFFNPSILNVVEMKNGWAIDYHTNIPDRKKEYVFGVNIIGDIFYLLDISLPEDQRGKGLGEKLYKMMEEIATEHGCKQIRQTPSGWTNSGEKRESYLLRRGWLKDGGEVYKPTGSTDAPCSS